MGPRRIRMAAVVAGLLLAGVMAQASGLPARTGHLPRRDSGDHLYDVRNIPRSLREGASAVIREDALTVDVADDESATETYRRVVTVFKPEGRGYGALNLGYDRYRKIKDVDGALLDQAGDEVRTLGGDDIKDESAIAGFVLYEDARVRKMHLYHDTYPYTVVFTYRLKYDGYVGWPSWEAQDSDDPVEHTRFEVILPAAETLRYWTSDSTAKPVITAPEKGRTSYVWESRNLPELTEDQMDEDIERRTTVVHVAPGKFRYADIPGDMTSWLAFGRWEGDLYTGRGVLPDAAVADVRAAIAAARGTREKIDTLYRYMQARTRYVAVELGIGGHQPFDARYVHEMRYGDCKALSNYMVSLLHAAGITAYPALVSAGGYRSRVVEEFPSDRFNHVIVCVPEGKDSLWLECTSAWNPPGHLGTFTENRPALLMTPGGGSLVHTPASRAADNRCGWSGRITIEPNGGAHAAITNIRTGDQSDNARYEMISASPSEKEDWLMGELEVPGTVLRTHTEEGLRSLSGLLRISLTADMPVLASRSSGRLFLQPNLTDRSFKPLRDIKGRRSPARLPYPYVDTDSLLYVLPQGFVSEALPAPVVLMTPFGRFFSATIAQGDTALFYMRRIELDRAEIPAASYNDYAAFLRAVSKADKAQVVLRQRE